MITSRAFLVLFAILWQFCRAGEPMMPPGEMMGTRVEIRVKNIEWEAGDNMPSSVMVYRAFPRPLDASRVEALAAIAERYSIPKSATMPEDLGVMGKGAISYELYDNDAPKAMYYQPTTGTFILGVDPSGGYASSKERTTDPTWPGLPSEVEAYDMALGLFPEFGLKEEDFYRENGRLAYTVSNKSLGWFDPATQTRRREPTTITLKFYRSIGGHRVGSSGQGGCALFEFGPRKKLMSVEWRMRVAQPWREMPLKNRKQVMSDIGGGKAYAKAPEIRGESLTIQKIELRPHEGGSSYAQDFFYPMYQVSGLLVSGDAKKEITLTIPALRD